MIESIAPIFAGENAALPTSAITAEKPVQTDFATWLTRELDTVNQGLINADTQVRRLAIGETQNLHETMIAIEKAKASFELVVQVRNRILEAYQEVMRTQV